MNKVKLFQWTSLLLAVLNIALIAFVVMNKPRNRGPHDQKDNKRIIIEKLQFDEEQVVQYNQLIQEHLDAISSLDKEILKAKQELYGLLNHADASKKEALIATIGEKQKAVEEVHFNHFLQIKSLCRSDQQDQFESLTEELARMFANQPKPKNP